MFKLIKFLERNGLSELVFQLHSRIRSLLMKRRYNYLDGFLVGANTVWLSGRKIKVGKNLRVGRRCRIESIEEHNGYNYTPHLVFGNNVSINDDVHIGCLENISIGNNVLMASKIYISDHNHGNYRGSQQSSIDEPPSKRRLSSEKIIIEDDVWIGEMVSILPGTTIGRGSIIGANSVVSRDIPPYTIAVGAPARPIKFFDANSQTWQPYSAVNTGEDK